MKRFACCIAVTSLVSVGVVLTGCSEAARPPTYPVTGTITWQSKPAVGASVVFVPSGPGAEAAAGITDNAGQYRLTTYVAGDGARPGKYRVKVSKYERGTMDSSKMVRNLTYEEEQAIYDPTAKPTPPPKNLFPPKYESEETSGITHTVTEGPTTLDLTIE